MAKCPHCNEENQDQSKFCANCGAQLIHHTKPTERPSPQSAPLIPAIEKPKAKLHGCMIGLIVAMGLLFGIGIVSAISSYCSENKAPKAKSAKELLSEADYFFKTESNYDMAIKTYNEIINKFPQTEEAKVAVENLALAQESKNKQILANADAKSNNLIKIWQAILGFERQKEYQKALDQFKYLNTTINEIKSAVSLGYQTDSQTTEIMSQADAKSQKVKKAYDAELAEISKKAEMLARLTFAKEYENQLLDNGINADVTVSGKNKDYIKMEWALVSKVTAHQIAKGDILLQMQNLGFKRFTITNGLEYSNETYYWDFNK